MIYGKRPINSYTLIIYTPLNLNHFGNLFVHKTVVLIIHTYPNFRENYNFTVRIIRAFSFHDPENMARR
jgi:hypothetical protein